MTKSKWKRPEFGGEFICGDVVFWVGHRAYVELTHVVGKGKVFMFRGVTLDGKIVDRWINGGETMGLFEPDPSDVDRLTFSEESELDDLIDHIFGDDGFPLINGEDFDDRLTIDTLPRRG